MPMHHRSWWNWQSCRTRRLGTAPHRSSSSLQRSSSAPMSLSATKSTPPASLLAFVWQPRRCVVGASAVASTMTLLVDVRTCCNSTHPLPSLTTLSTHSRQACKYVTNTMAIDTESLGKDTLLNAAKTCMSSKIIGADEEHFASMAVAAVQAVKTTAPSGNVRCAVFTCAVHCVGAWGMMCVDVMWWRRGSGCGWLGAIWVGVEKRKHTGKHVEGKRRGIIMHMCTCVSTHAHLCTPPVPRS